MEEGVSSLRFRKAWTISSSQRDAALMVSEDSL